MHSNRLVHLECSRGIASIIVLFHHFTLAFMPALTTSFLHGNGIKHTPLFVLINGQGAVTFFFVLSGFVLTTKLYRNFSHQALFSSALKRLPRLLVPAAASILVGYVIFVYGNAPHKLAAELASSEWLALFGNAHLPPDHTPSLLDAARQSLLVFFVPDNFYYNSNLWTMRNEYYGSMLVFGIVVLFGAMQSNRFIIITLVHTVSLAMSLYLYRAMAPFILGSYLAFYLSQRKAPLDIGTLQAVGLVALALIGFCADHWLANIVASFVLLIVLVTSQPLIALASGRSGALLGTLSFPIYLVHTLVILSASSVIYSACSPFLSQAAALMITLAATMVISVVASIPFVFLDTYWTAFSNSAARALTVTLQSTFRRIATTKEKPIS